MAPLRTSKETYNRILWDPGFDEASFLIGYEDRMRGLVEVPLTAFEPEGDIPWHRVQHFCYGDTLVWDRQTRTDNTAAFRLPPQSTFSPDLGGDVATFCSSGAFFAFLRRTKDATSWLPIRPARDYPSFVKEVVVRPRLDGPSRLTIERISYAMDWMGDATSVAATYEFASLDALLAHGAQRHDCTVTDLSARMPALPPHTPTTSATGRSAELTSAYREAWRRLQADFAAGLLFEHELNLVGARSR